MHMRAATPLLFLLLALPFSPKRVPITFEEAVKAAEANEKTEAGKTYAADVRRHFSEQHETSLKECTHTAGAEERMPFQLAVRVGKRGVVEEVLVRPANAVALCMKRTTEKDRLKKPPTANTWVLVPLTPAP